MSSRSGKILEVIDGAHKGKQVIAYNADQTAPVIQLKKALVKLPEGHKVLISISKLKLIGFTD